LNREITAPQVRLIGVDGEQVGVVSIAEALEQALAAGTDLVEIAPGAKPPVVKILDWGKYRYEQTKLNQKNRKGQRNQDVKQVRVGLKIGQHDLDVKVRHAREFLEHGHKVKVSLRFRGREVTHPDLGRAVLERFMTQVEDLAVREQEPTLSGREMTMVLGLNKTAKSSPPPVAID
jgi:translation initiation factor IF-3